MGTEADDQRCSHKCNDNDWLQSCITQTHEWIFKEGKGVTSKWIQDMLGTGSH